MQLPMLTLNGMLLNAFMGNMYTDKETGEVTPATLKVQMMCDVPQKSGDTKKELVTMSVKDETLTDLYHSLMGKNIRVGVGVIAQGRNLNFWILPGVRPELVDITAMVSAPGASSSNVKSPLDKAA